MKTKLSNYEYSLKYERSIFEGIYVEGLIICESEKVKLLILKGAH